MLRTIEKIGNERRLSVGERDATFAEREATLRAWQLLSTCHLGYGPELLPDLRDLGVAEKQRT
jgi:hypothetical protein